MKFHFSHLRYVVFIMVAAGAVYASVPVLAADLPNPVMFVTQVPVPADFATIGSVFANHLGDVGSAARGGDLWIRYPDGALRNLTAEAGYGSSGFQGTNSIAVRDPDVNVSGTKAVFSMVTGSPPQQYQYPATPRRWQLYEITGFGRGQSVSVTRVANQPVDFNNIEPTYGSDGSILFTSDRPRNGQAHLYPQLDEYESKSTTTGIWKLDSIGGSLALLQHAPSGSFGPFVDTYGRVIFTRWDHLQQDQQAEVPGDGAFNWASEAAGAAKLPSVEVFPESRGGNATTYGLRFNHFFPWMIAQDGSGEETLNHIGRHELFNYFGPSFKNDPSLVDFNPDTSPRTNPNSIENLLQIAEDPTAPGRYFAIDAPEFGTHAAGQIVSMGGSPSDNADDMVITYVTPRSTQAIQENPVAADFTGHYRNPLPLSNGSMLAVWAAEPGKAENEGTRANPIPSYKFRIYALKADGAYRRPDMNAPLTTGITKSVSWYDPDVLVSYNGALWELSPIEVRAHIVPPLTGAKAPEAPEAQAYAEAGVDADAFRAFLAARNLGVIVSRNVTTRDDADRQQPFNLRVPGGTQTIGNGGKLYDIAYMQFFQADQVRGLGGVANPSPGRRVLAQPLHDEQALGFMPPTPQNVPRGSVTIAADGSIAAIVPAERAMVWQSTSADSTPVVRERYWISVKPGEVLACSGCHGVNRLDQAGHPPMQNMPLAFKQLLEYWLVHSDFIFQNGFDSANQ